MRDMLHTNTSFTSPSVSRRASVDELRFSLCSPARYFEKNSLYFALESDDSVCFSDQSFPCPPKTKIVFFGRFTVSDYIFSPTTLYGYIVLDDT